MLKRDNAEVNSFQANDSSLRAPAHRHLLPELHKKDEKGHPDAGNHL